MATFVNDLRLTELATGEGSGTWGTTTNTNLELIGEAFSFGTEAITTNADTHTTTIADGSTDPGRSLFLKYTGTLDSACTITIAPNTVSKLWFIENATSGSQNIIISQGSGADITIPNGQTKAIYSDGAGSGAAMVDAFQDLSIPDLFVDDDLTVGDDLILSSDSAIIKFGADADTTLTHTDGSGLTLNSTNKIMFNDASQFIQGSSATVLSLGATDKIDLTATAIDVNGTIDVSGNATLGGTLGVTGAVTANAGISIDNITIDGTEIDLSSGDLTIDVAGDIILDANGADVLLKDDGTQFGEFTNSSSDFVIKSSVSDKDMLFKGNDGGSEITALTLDMSAAGAATFNDKITAVGTSVFTNLDISGDVDIDGTTNLDVVDIDGAVDMASTLNIGSGSGTTASAGFDEFVIQGGNADIGMAFLSPAANDKTQTIAFGDSNNNKSGSIAYDHSADSLTLDAAGDITFDADGADINLKDGGTLFGQISNASGLFLVSSISDADIFLRGNDGGSFINALSLDMSASGAATFNSTITAAGGSANNNDDANILTLNASQHARLLVDTSSTSGHRATLVLESNGNETTLSTTGSASSLDVASGDLTLDVAGDIILDADGGDILLQDGGTDIGKIQLDTAGLILDPVVSDKDFFVNGNDGGSGITALRLDMSDAGAAIFNDSITSNSGMLASGSSSPLQIQKSGTSGFINQSDSGDLIYRMGSGFSEKMRLVSGGSLLVNTASFSSLGTIVLQQLADDKGIAIIDSGSANTLFIQNNGDINVIGNNASIPMAFETSSSENARFISGGGFAVGTTATLGSVTNSNRITGGIFNTFADVVAAANNTATTMVSLGSAMATYIACAGFNGIGNTGAFGASAIIHADGTSYTLTHLANPTGMTFSMSGSNVQITHTAGSTLNVTFSIIRIQ